MKWKNDNKKKKMRCMLAVCVEYVGEWPESWALSWLCQEPVFSSVPLLRPLGLHPPVAPLFFFYPSETSRVVPRCETRSIVSIGVQRTVCYFFFFFFSNFSFYLFFFLFFFLYFFSFFLFIFSFLVIAPLCSLSHSWNNKRKKKKKNF